MTSLITLALLPVLVCASADQQDLLCADSYAEFESASVGSNISGAHIRNQLYNAFYTPNHHLPYSVLVTYQLVLHNGTRFNLSSEQDCSTELWVWLSSPVFLVKEATYLNRYLLFTLNYFMEWRPPHVIITTTVAPCTDQISDFLNQMTAALQDYALGHTEDKTNVGYVQRGCGTSTFDTLFLAVDMVGNTPEGSGLIVCGAIFQIMFIWMVSGVLLQMTFKSFAQKTFAYSYDLYGMFWGVSTTALGILVALYGVHVDTAFLLITNVKGTVSIDTTYLIIIAVLSPLVLELPIAIYIARKATVAVPWMFKYPAVILCCGRKRHAESFVTTVALWAVLVALQLVLLHGILIALTISTEPYGIATSAMLLVLAFSCLANMFSLLFTIFAHVFTPSHQRVASCSKVVRAVVVLPLLLAIMCYGAGVISLESVINMDTKQINPLSFFTSIATPILLVVLSIFLKRFISAWLKWSPKEIEHGTDTSHTQEAVEELLEP